MLYFDMIYVSKGIDVNKTSATESDSSFNQMLYK